MTLDENLYDKKRALSRRELLKALSALSGAVAVSSLVPTRWAKPEVGAGALPVHAQGTMPEFADCDIQVISIQISWLELEFYVKVTPPTEGIKIRWNYEQRTPSGEIVGGGTGFPKETTDANGEFRLLYTAPRAYRAKIINAWYTFVDPLVGQGSCWDTTSF